MGRENRRSCKVCKGPLTLGLVTDGHREMILSSSANESRVRDREVSRSWRKKKFTGQFLGVLLWGTECEPSGVAAKAKCSRQVPGKTEQWCARPPVETRADSIYHWTPG